MHIILEICSVRLVFIQHKLNVKNVVKQKKTGEKTLKVEEFLPIYSEFYKMPAKNFGTYEDFMEGLKLFDKESNGLMSLAELTQVLVAMAEKLEPRIVEEILRSTNTKDDAEGMFNYEVFVRALLQGPFPNEST